MADRKSKSKAKKKTGNSKPALKMAPKKIPPIKDPLSKGNLIRTITDACALNRKDVVAMLDCLSQIMEKHVKTGGPGTFVLPGLLKIKVVKRPARPARRGINPFTKEEVMFKAKPASRKVKILALKKLKEMVA
jgi:nucleoid DNA-binding protein